MRSHWSTVLAGVFVLANLAICWPALGAEEKPAFAIEPAVTKIGNGFKIAFAVTKPTDVEVSILNVKGEVVRHLAAGALGAKGAPPMAWRRQPGLP